MAEIALSDAARKRLAPVLDKFEPFEASSYQARVAVERERVPVPWLPYLALAQIIGCRDLGAAEKTMWQVPLRYDGIEAMLTYEKFGLRLYLNVPHDGDSQKLAAAVVGKLNAIVKTIEKETLQNLAKQKLDSGEVTLFNQQHRLRRAYEHFRTEGSICSPLQKPTIPANSGPSRRATSSRVESRRRLSDWRSADSTLSRPSMPTSACWSTY